MQRVIGFQPRLELPSRSRASITLVYVHAPVCAFAMSDRPLRRDDRIFLEGAARLSLVTAARRVALIARISGDQLLCKLRRHARVESPPSARWRPVAYSWARACRFPVVLPGFVDSHPTCGRTAALDRVRLDPRSSSTSPACAATLRPASGPTYA